MMTEDFATAARELKEAAITFIVGLTIFGVFSVALWKGCEAHNKPSMSNCGVACSRSGQAMVSFKDNECICAPPASK